MKSPVERKKAGVEFARRGLARSVLPLGVCAGLLVQPLLTRAAIVLDPNNPLANFTVEPPGSSRWTPGALLLITDDSPSDFIGFFGAEADAISGIELDLVSSFQVLSNPTAGMESGVRFIITDGVSKSAIACLITKAGTRGIGLAAGADFYSDSNYPDNAFAPVDWTLPTSFRMRRTADNRAELVEINGAPPVTPKRLDTLPSRTRSFASAEFGCYSTEAVTTIGISAMRTERSTTGVGDPGSTSIALAIRVASRPGAGGRLRVEFALHDGSPARLDLMDVAGRILASEQVGTLGPGTHQLDLSERIDLRSGIYFLRLTQGGSEARARAAMVR